MKLCKKCDTQKEIELFSKSKRCKDGLNNWCKICIKDYYISNKKTISAYKKNHYFENKDIYLDKASKWREDNKEVYLEYLKNWRDNNKEYNKEYLKSWHINNQGKRSEYYHKDRINNPHIIAWRNSLKLALKRLGQKKESLTINILDYSAIELKLHIESLFTEGMSWENWGEWHIDHKYPLSKFEADTPINIVNSLNNLQPLWAIDNRSKNNKIINE